MTDTPDIELLARRYLDLWQHQLSALAGDPALAEDVAKAFTAFSRGAAGRAAAADVHPGKQQDGAHDQQSPSQPPSAAQRAAPAAAAPDGAGFDPGHLLGRIAELEERVLRLETALAGRSRSPRAGYRHRWR